MNATDTTSLDWDAWRNAYPGMSYKDQVQFHSAIYARHPEQKHYDTTLVARAIEQVVPEYVVELGGWDGQLAHHMLSEYAGIHRWTNVELCKEAAWQGLLGGHHNRYRAPSLGDWYWTQRWTTDLFVASHTIEHLSYEHLDQTIGATHAKALFLDAPLMDYGLRWQGFTGTHILQCGWQGVTELCNKHGYQLDWAVDHETKPESGDWARACLYVKESA